MESRPLPEREAQESSAFPREAIIIFCGAGLALLVFFVVGLWIQFGFVPAFWLLLSCSVLGGLGFLFTRWEHHRHDVADRKHLRELTRTALANHHSIEFNPATRTLRTISPLTIPNGPLTIKDINLGNALPAALPHAPAFSSIIEQVRDGRWCLGYGAAGAIFGMIDDLLSTAIVGRPGTGKTTLLRFVCAQLLKVGGQPVIWDPHANIADEVSDLLACAVEPQEIYQNSRQVERVLDRRLQERREGKPAPETFLLLADEWPVIAALTPGAVDVAKRVVLEGRKVGMYALISGQGLPAKLLDGTLVRDALSSRYVFNTTPQQARLAGLDNETAKELLTLLETSGPGHAILASSRLKPEIISIPHTSVSDMRGCIPETGVYASETAAQADASSTVNVSAEADETSVNTLARIGNDIRETIRRLNSKGMAHREIASAVGLSGRNYGAYQAVCRELGIIIE